MKRFFVVAAFLFPAVVSQAQQQIIEKGTIEFERKTNLYKAIEADENEDNSAFYETFKKQLPEYKISYFNLSFDRDKTLYAPGREPDAGKKVPDWMESPAEDNIVYTDLSTQTFISEKKVFEATYNIQDSLRKAEWKITDDKRTIAGFECRKATTIIMDSVFVFAFYTDQIVTNGGPESFSGLPGMILGIAIPRIHTTWFATKLEAAEIKPNTIVPPQKGKKTNLSSLKTILHNSLKDWGKYAERNTWNIII